MSNANSLGRMVGGVHYTSLVIQPVEFIAANEWDYFSGNILKYLTRWRSKGGVEDLKKALHYAEMRRDLGISRQYSPFVRFLERVMNAIWRWRFSGETTPPISMEEYVNKNGIPLDEQNLFFLLDDWVREKDGPTWLIYSLNGFIKRKETVPLA